MTRRSGQLQLDLWGETARAEQDAADKAAAAAAWEARFERADWVAPYDTAGGMKAGDSQPGWRCPACGQIEPNEFLLGNNHGYHLYDPGHVPYGAEFGATCFKLELQKNHRIYDERMAMIRHLIDAGLDDEQIAERIGFWPAPMIARDRARFAKEARRAAKAGEPVEAGHGPGCPCASCGGTCTCSSCAPDPRHLL